MVRTSPVTRSSINPRHLPSGLSLVTKLSVNMRVVDENFICRPMCGPLCLLPLFVAGLFAFFQDGPGGHLFLPALITPIILSLMENMLVLSLFPRGHSS